MSARTVVLVVGDQVAVFRPWPPQCTARTAKRPRTANPLLPRGHVFRCTHPTVYGIPGAPEPVDVDGGRIEGIRLEGELAERLLAQRCMYHLGDKGVAYCRPEWKPFDPSKRSHRELLIEEPER